MYVLYLIRNELTRKLHAVFLHNIFPTECGIQIHSLNKLQEGFCILKAKSSHLISDNICKTRNNYLRAETRVGQHMAHATENYAMDD